MQIANASYNSLLDAYCNKYPVYVIEKYLLRVVQWF